jgi:leucyl/phenylalanyl-tRNA--protein transferase
MAFIDLAEHLSRWGFLLIDCQMFTPHLASLGAKEVPMLEFQNHLDENLAFGVDSLWGGC